MKKITALLCLVGIFSMPLAASAITIRSALEQTFSQAKATFPDVPQEHPNFLAIAFFNEDEIVGGYPDSTFKPEGEINRAELMKLLPASLISAGQLRTKQHFKTVSLMLQPSG